MLPFPQDFGVGLSVWGSLMLRKPRVGLPGWSSDSRAVAPSCFSCRAVQSLSWGFTSALSREMVCKVPEGVEGLGRLGTVREIRRGVLQGDLVLGPGDLRHQKLE